MLRNTAKYLAVDGHLCRGCFEEIEPLEEAVVVRVGPNYHAYHAACWDEKEGASPDAVQE